MKGVAVRALPAAAALLLAACAGAPPVAAPGKSATVAPSPAAPAFSALAARFTDRALEQERAGDLRLARDFWGVVAALRPDAAEPKRRLAELEARCAAEADRRVREGKARLHEGKREAARRELLLALAAEPAHAAALEALRSTFEPDAVSHAVAAGDTLESIAKKHYGDPGLAALVAIANDLEPGARPSPGTLLTLPNLATPAPPSAKRSPGAPEHPDSADETDPDHPGREGAAPAPPPAVAPAPAAPAAPAAAPGRAENAAAAAEIERSKKEQAEELYTAGVSFFINQKLDEAIRSWEQTLALNPDHPKALRDIEKARALQQKLKELR